MKMLDVGSGHQPLKEASHLSDITIGKDEHRAGFKTVIDVRPFIVCSTEYLPFKKNSFHYVVSRHVLEHTDNPIKALNEMKRISKRGFVEIPSSWWEMVFTREWDMHKWNITKKVKVRSNKKGVAKALRYVLGKMWLFDFRIRLRERFFIKIFRKTRKNVFRW